MTTTLHDLTAWILPECHTPAMVAADKEFAECVLRRADGIIAVSENTRRDAVRILDLNPEKIYVTHLGIPAEYFSVPPESVERTRAAYKLNRPYFLFVGTIEPRKNVDTLLTAWEGLPADFRCEHELVIAGMPGWRSENTINRLNQANRESQSIRYFGYVQEADMPALTAAARAFVYPSLYEGFGIPVAQAMAAGCPVITSNVSSLPEITKGSAILVDPRSPGELRRAIVRMDEFHDLRCRLKLEGIKTASNYTWHTAAAVSRAIFSHIAESTLM